LIAATLTNTLEPHSSENGEFLSEETGIVHVVIVEADWSQFVRSAEKVFRSLCLIVIEYPVIILPPLSG